VRLLVFLEHSQAIACRTFTLGFGPSRRRNGALDRLDFADGWCAGSQLSPPAIGDRSKNVLGGVSPSFWPPPPQSRDRYPPASDDRSPADAVRGNAR
jgi:hypothetical protein